MKSATSIKEEIARLEKVNLNAVDSNTETGIRYSIEALKWAAEKEETSPFDALGLEE